MNLRSVLLALVAAVRFVINLGCSLLALGYLAILLIELAPIPTTLSHNLMMLRVDHALTPSIRFVSGSFGWHWPRTTSAPNFAPLLLAIAAVVVRTILDSIFQRVDVALHRMLKGSAPALRARAAATATQPSRLSAESERERAALLKRYREIEDALKSSSRKTCTFLSIDVVGSTQMKVGERKTAIDATFQAYEELVRETFDRYGVWKETWTPDGVMACFLDRDLAVNAAKEILSGLAQFNRESNQLRTPIAVRCGLNEGEVTIFDDSALEKVADHVIDVAGHMQKHAGEDALQISDEVYARLRSTDGFTATGRDVDGYQTYEWKPPVAEAAPAPA